MTQKNNVNPMDVFQAVSDSDVLGNSKNQINLLHFLLTYPDDNLDALIIASRVFGRKEGFNNSNNSIVRTEMYRLRKNLKEFNQSFGAEQGLTITIPSRKYVPLITLKEQFQSDQKQSTIPGSDASVDSAQNVQSLNPALFRLISRVAVTVLVFGFLGLGLWGSGWNLKPIPIKDSAPEAVQGQKLDQPHHTDQNLLQVNSATKTQPDAPEFFESIFPTIRIIVDDPIFDSKEQEDIYQKFIQHYLIIRPSANEAIHLVVEGEADFTIRISAISGDDSSHIKFSGLIINDLNIVIWRKTYELDTSETIVSERNLRALGNQMDFDFFSVTGALPQAYMSQMGFQNPKAEFYACIIGAVYRYQEKHKIFNRKSYLDCLEPSRTAHEYDKAYIHLLRARIFAKQEQGYLEKTVKNPIEHASAEIEHAAFYALNSRMFHVARLVVERVRLPRDNERLEKYLDEALYYHPDDWDVIDTAALTYAYFLGDIEKSKKFYLNDRSPFVQILIALYDNDKEKMAYYNNGFYIKSNHIYTVLMNARISCELQDQLQDVRESLRSAGVHSFEDYAKLYRSRRYAPNIEKLLIGEEVMKTCDVFSI